MFSVGPHSFTQTDAERTVGQLDKVWEWLMEGRDASVLTLLYPELTGDLATDLERVWAAWSAAGPALRTAGQLPTRASGTVAGLHLSNGGVPKTAVDRVAVDWSGVVGDSQAHRVVHGRPWQALCIWSSDVIDGLHAQGHPIAPGRAGENITLRDLPWADVRPGVRLQIGEVVCDVSAFALPCTSNKAWFTNGEFETMHHERGPVSRVYATVLQPGNIAVGDAAILEP